VSATGFDQWAGYPSEVIVNMQQAAGLRGMLHTDWTGGVAPERFANITDGTSNTLLAGERSTRTTPTRGTFWADAFNLYSLSGAYNQSASMLADYDACSKVANDVAQCKYGWGSYHANLVNFVYGDGSVRPIMRNIDMKIFTYLATIGNGESTGGDN
jgi:prepilin-type processing-associated H-X9-DG protein